MSYVQLQKIFGAPNMTGIIQLSADGIPDPFGAVPVNPRVCHGNTGSYTQYTGVRQNARMNNYGAPSRNRELREIGRKDVVLIHSNENIQLTPTDYMAVLAYDDLKRQEMGIQEVKRQMEALGHYQKNLRISAKAAAIFTGKIYRDESGNLLAPSQVAQAYGPAVDFGIPAVNQGQLTDDQGNAIITAAWSDPSTDIVTQLRHIKRTSEQRTGYKVTRAYYGEKIASYLSANNTVKEYLSRNQAAGKGPGTMFTDEGEIGHILGFDWIAADDCYFRDNSSLPEGAAQSFVGEDSVVFTPETAKFMETLEGTYPVPELASIITPVEPLMTGKLPYVEQKGMFAYGFQVLDPGSIKVVYGDTFMDVITIPSAIYQATVANFGS